MKIDLKKIVVILLNLLGLFCLVYFAIPYVTHDTYVRNPDAMLPGEAWDTDGMSLTIGLIPLTVANILGFKLVPIKNKKLNRLWVVPCMVCFVLVVSYLVQSFLIDYDEIIPDDVWDFACITLVICLIPLTVANILGFKIFVPLKNKKINLLWFIYGTVCLILTVFYLVQLFS